jgi:uncharacterized OB-fold protein
MHAGFPLPDTTWEAAAPFWQGASAGELRIPRCEACGQLVWYPRERCPYCGHDTMEWKAVSGRGRLFSWAVVRHAFLPQFEELVPFVTGLVTLEEDSRVRVVSGIVDAETDELTMDLPVRVTFRDLSFPGIERRVTAPLFRPDRGEE